MHRMAWAKLRSLAQLLEDQDAEVFLILPRLVLLSGLREPKHIALPGWLLPELEVCGPQLAFTFLCPGRGQLRCARRHRCSQEARRWRESLATWPGPS